MSRRRKKLRENKKEKEKKNTGNNNNNLIIISSNKMMHLVRNWEPVVSHKESMSVAVDVRPVASNVIVAHASERLRSQCQGIDYRVQPSSQVNEIEERFPLQMAFAHVAVMDFNTHFEAFGL